MSPDAVSTPRLSSLTSIVLATISVFLGSSPGAVAAATRPIVVELFTSQGCSSCPPADRFLATLSATRPDLLALDFHVTYWNDLGWRDPFALQSATLRQRFYAALLVQDDVYTPEMVVDGQRGLVGSDRAAALAAIETARSTVGSGVALLVTRGADGSVVLAAGIGAGSGRLVLVGFDPAHVTSVGGGENSGRLLREVDVVRSVVDGGEWSGQSLERRFPPLLGIRVAALLQAPDGRFLGVTATP